MISMRFVGPVKNVDWRTSLKRLVSPHRFTTLALRNRSFRSSNKEVVDSEPDPTKPIKYSTSRAAQWTAAEGQGLAPSDRAPFERTIVCGSLIILLIYFCILREENDIDQAMGLTLQERLAYSEAQYNAKRAK